MIVTALFGVLAFGLAVLVVLLRAVRQSEALRHRAAATFLQTFGLGETIERLITPKLRELLCRVKLRGRVIDCGSGMGICLRHLLKQSDIEEIVCIETNPHLLPCLEKIAASAEKGKRVKIYNGSLQNFITENPQSAGTFDSVLSAHTLVCMGHVSVAAKMMQICLKKGGKLVFLEPVLAPTSKPKTRFFQKICRVPMILMCGGYDPCRNIAKSLRSVSWEHLEIEEFSAKCKKRSSLQSILKYHVMGHATAKEAKGGLHQDTNGVIGRAMKRLGKNPTAWRGKGSFRM